MSIFFKESAKLTSVFAVTETNQRIEALLDSVQINEVAVEKTKDLNVAHQTDYLFEKTSHDLISLTFHKFILEDQSTVYQVSLKSSQEERIRQIGFTVTFAEDHFSSMLAAPFDNDKWAKFIDYPIGFTRPSHMFTGLRGNHGQDLLAGALDMTDWKTGFIFKDNDLSCLSGFADELSRDFESLHGVILGKEVRSARIYVNESTDYQQSFPQYGDTIAKLYPRDRWHQDVPFGWNSWAALMAELTYEKYQLASSFMSDIQEKFHMENGKQWINLDAMWNGFTNKLEDGVKKIEERNQLPGFYLAPFITTPPFNREMPGTNGRYFFEDALLRDHQGNILRHVDGLYSLDPTHPGTIAYTNYEISRMKEWGFKFVKIDFLGHAAREGKFFDSAVTTGMQAYQCATDYMREFLKDDQLAIFVSLSIAPIFSFGFGHSRRISCDAFGSIADSEYVNNSTTYLWWMGKRIYEYNDPDHLVLYKSYDMNSISYSEAMMRLNTGIVCGGPMIYSDDFSFPEARERAHSLLGNQAVLELAYDGISFAPVKNTYQGTQSAKVFVRKSKGKSWLALFNYNPAADETIRLNLSDLLEEKMTRAKNLYSGKEWEVNEPFFYKLLPGESTIVELR